MTINTKKQLKTIQNDDELAEIIGNEIVNFLKLRKVRGQFETSWGTKTPKGLSRCISRIIEESSEKYLKGV